MIEIIISAALLIVPLLIGYDVGSDKGWEKGFNAGLECQQRRYELDAREEKE